MGNPVQDPRFRSDLVFNEINKQFITLKDNEMREYNVHLKTVLNTFIEHMKQKDVLFNACYQRIAYVGSYYEGLKVGKPEEFDLNVIINLPINYDLLEIIIASERPGYIKIKASPDIPANLRKHVRWSEYSGGSTEQPGSGVRDKNVYYLGGNRPKNKEVELDFIQTPNNDDYSNKSETVYQSQRRPRKKYYNSRTKDLKNKEVELNVKNTLNDNSLKKSRRSARQRRRCRKKAMDSWFDKNNFLDQNKFRQWFESVVNRALGSSEYVNRKYDLIANGKKYRLHHKKSGPAWTMKIDVPGGHTVDVDLVPALEFRHLPPKPFKNRNTMKQNWFAISKPLDGPSNNIMWRPSFYEREQEILKGNMKQVIRQMKKLRDTQNFKSIASYYIKTLFLHELERQQNISEFQRLSSTYLFFYMLQKFHETCTRHEIYDFWNPKNNLLSNISTAEMSNISSRLTRIIKDIEKRIASDPYVIAEYILSNDELARLKDNDLSKLSNAMAKATLHNQTEPAQQAESSGFLTGIWNSFWGTSPAPAAQ